MRRVVVIAIIVAVMAMVSVQVNAAVTSASLLSKVKAAEANVKDFKADMVITEANKKNVQGMGEGYGDILKLEKAVIQYKKPDMIRYDGFAQGIKATYIQNGYTKLILAAMIRQKVNVKNAPGKRQDTLDLGFISSRIWTDNNVKVVATEKNGVVKLNLDPKFGDNDKRHDFVWINTDNLRVIKREKFRGSGEMRVRTVFSDYETLGGKLPIATLATLYNKEGKELGTVKYKNVKDNVGLSDSLFSLNQK